MGSKIDQQPEGEVAREPEGEVARQAKFFQPTEPIPNSIRDRSLQPDITQDVISVQTCSSEDSKSLNVEQTYDRSGRPGKDTVAVQDDPEVYHEAETLNIDDETLRERIEADMDFKIPGLPHSTVKQLQSTSVRELIQKIQNHPNRHFQRDLRQNQSSNPFSPESKQMIREVGNIELCELLETEPKAQCKVCLSYWNIGIVYCTCGHFLREGRVKIRNSSSTRWTFLQFPTTSSRKDDLTDIDMVRNRETGNIMLPTSLKKKCKRKFFQGIHNRMIENDRDADACRQMDALADEDYTHH